MYSLPTWLVKKDRIELYAISLFQVAAKNFERCFDFSISFTPYVHLTLSGSPSLQGETAVEYRQVDRKR